MDQMYFKWSKLGDRFLYFLSSCERHLQNGLRATHLSLIQIIKIHKTMSFDGRKRYMLGIVFLGYLSSLDQKEPNWGGSDLGQVEFPDFTRH